MLFIFISLWSSRTVSVKLVPPPRVYFPQCTSDHSLSVWIWAVWWCVCLTKRQFCFHHSSTLTLLFPGTLIYDLLKWAFQGFPSNISCFSRMFTTQHWHSLGKFSTYHSFITLGKITFHQNDQYTQKIRCQFVIINKINMRKFLFILICCQHIVDHFENKQVSYCATIQSFKWWWRELESHSF